MSRLVASCTILAVALHALACSDPTDPLDPDTSDTADVRLDTSPEANLPAAAPTDPRTAYSGAIIAKAESDRGKPQPQPWKGDDPVPKDPGPKGPGGSDQSGGPSSGN